MSSFKLNCVQIQGRIPNFEAIPCKYKKGNEKKETNSSFYGKLSIRTNKKDENDEFYIEKLIPIQAYSGTADLLYNSCEGREIIIIGRIVTFDPYEDDDGVKQNGGLKIQAEKICFENDKEGAQKNNKNNKNNKNKKASTNDDDEDEDDEEEDTPKSRLKNKNKKKSWLRK